MDVAITGSSGLIGKALVKALRADGHRPVRLVRRPVRGEDEIRYDPAAGQLDAASLEGIDAVVNLAGAGIGDRRWTDAYKKLILESRTDTTTLVATTIAGLTDKPQRFLSGSAIGVYGDRGDEVLTEKSTAADTFLAEVVVQWESAALPAIDAGISTAFLRTGIVLSPRGGALAKQLPIFKAGLGGRFGDGSQFQSWISLDDEVRAIMHLLGSEVTGPVNLVAPNPVTNAEFTRILGRVLRRPTVIPIPKFGPALLLGTELTEALLFESVRAEPAVLHADEFEFWHPELEVALRDLLEKP